MGRPNGGQKKADKDSTGNKSNEAAMALAAQRQACYESLQTKPALIPSMLQTMATTSFPSQPSLPLAQAAKHAANCAFHIFTKVETHTWGLPRHLLESVMLKLLRLAVQWAQEGAEQHKSGLCALLYLSLGFLVEDQAFRSVIQLKLLPTIKKMSDPRADELDEAGKRPESSTQGGPMAGNRAVQAAASRTEQRLVASEPPAPKLSQDEQLEQLMDRISEYKGAMDIPLEPALLSQVMQRAHLHQLMQQHDEDTEVDTGVDHEAVKAAGRDAPGKFRTVRDEETMQLLVVAAPVPAEAPPFISRVPSISPIFERSIQEEVAANTNRLPPAKEKAANEKASMILEHFKASAELNGGKIDLESALKVPVRLVSDQLERELKDCQRTRREMGVQAAALHQAVLKHWLESDKFYTHLDPRGGVFTPSYDSVYPALLAQASEKLVESCHSCNSAETTCREILAGKDLLWQGNLPQSLKLFTRDELEEALLQGSPARDGEAEGAGLLHVIRGLLCMDGTHAAQEAELDAVARQPRPWHAGVTQADEMESMCSGYALSFLSNVREIMRHGGLGISGSSPSYDASNMEVVAELHAHGHERSSRGENDMLACSSARPALADLRALSMDKDVSCQTPVLDRIERFFYPDQAQVQALAEEVNVKGLRMAMLLRGRLVLALQYWLWRARAWQHRPSWEPQEGDVGLPVQMAQALDTLSEAVRLSDAELLHHCSLLQVNTQSKDTVCGGFLGSEIDEPFYARYRFHAAEDEAGNAAGVAGMAYDDDLQEEEQQAEDERNATEPNGVAENGHLPDAEGQKPDRLAERHICCGCPSCAKQHRKWLGKGPSPLLYPAPEGYSQRDPAEKAELIEEILDILDILRMSKLLCMDIIRALAMRIIAGLGADPHVRRIPGANLLQVTWEHMTLLPAAVLERLRDALLRFLGQSAQCTAPVQEVEELYGAAANELPVCVALSQDKSDFYLLNMPVRQEVTFAQQEILQRRQSSPRPFPGDEQAPWEELPGPPPDPPKQDRPPRSKGRPEAQLSENGAQPSKPGVPAPADYRELAEEILEADGDTTRMFRVCVELLHGAGNKAAGMLPNVYYSLRPGASEAMSRQLLRAASCADMVSRDLLQRRKVSKTLTEGFGVYLRVEGIKAALRAIERAVLRSSGCEEDIKQRLNNLLTAEATLKDTNARLWDCGEGEVHTQAHFSGDQNGVLDELVAEWSQEAGKGPRDGSDAAWKINHCKISLQRWQREAVNAKHSASRVRQSKVLPEKAWTVDALWARLQAQEHKAEAWEELVTRLDHRVQGLREALLVGILALTSLDHRMSALRLAMVQIQRRVGQQLKVYNADVLQTMIRTTISGSLYSQAREGLESKQQLLQEALMDAEDRQKAEAAAKRAAKRERLSKQKAEALRVQEEKAAAEAAEAAAGQAADRADATEAEEIEGDTAGGPETSEKAGANGAANGAGLESHSLGQDAYSDDDDDAHEEEGKPSSADRRPTEHHEQPDREPSEHSSDRGIGNADQQSALETEAQKKRRKKKNAAARRRAQAEEEAAAEQSLDSAGPVEGAVPDDWPADGKEDLSEWQEARPKRSQQRQREQQKQEPTTPQKGRQGSSTATIADAPQKADPIVASLARQKPDVHLIGGCLKCYDRSHSMRECPQLAALSHLHKLDIQIAFMDGDRERAEAIQQRPPRRTCHLCDAQHHLSACPWLLGMSEPVMTDLMSCYRRLKIHDKDNILRQWLRVRREKQRQPPAPAPSPMKEVDSRSPHKPAGQQPSRQVANGTGAAMQADGWRQQQQQQQATAGRRAAPVPTRPAPQERGQPQAAQHPSYNQRGIPQAPLAPASPRQQQQQQQHSGWKLPSQPEVKEPQSPGRGLVGNESTSEMLLHPSPARPQPRSAYVPVGPRPPQHARPDKEWEGDGDEEELATAPRALNQGAEPVLGEPASHADKDFDHLLSMLQNTIVSEARDSSAAAPAPKGWSQMATGVPADPSLGPTPGEAMRSSSSVAKQEDDDMQAAIQASLTQARPPPAQWSQVAQSAAQREQQEQQALVVATPGLQNQIGEYNCFLNVVIQCLWHCTVFKARFSALAQGSPATVQSNDVVAGLADLFGEFDAQEKQTESAARPVVAPTRLRDALHALNPDRFSIGEMSDTAEVLGTIYEQLGALPSVRPPLTAVFEQPVCEAVHCRACSKDTHRSSFVQSFYCVSATALRMQGMLSLDDNEGAMPPLGELLLGIDAQDQKTCDTDEGGCGQLWPIQRFLEGEAAPVFTLQLAWESHAESSEAIAEVLDTVQEGLDIGQIYMALGSKEYCLHSMVCYYGEHYHAFVHTEGRWVAFDDATLSDVGPWEAVVKKCILGKIQPSLLFYEERLGG